MLALTEHNGKIWQVGPGQSEFLVYSKKIMGHVFIFPVFMCPLNLNIG